MEMDQFRAKKKSFPLNENEVEEDDDEEDIIIKENKNRRKKRQAPYLIFPEILCIIDYDGYRYVLIKKKSSNFFNFFFSELYFLVVCNFCHADALTKFLLRFYALFSRLHGKDNVAIKRYVISFWNGIDLRYKLLKDPGVKISIAGIIISRVSIIFPFFS